MQWYVSLESLLLLTSIYIYIYIYIYIHIHIYTHVYPHTHTQVLDPSMKVEMLALEKGGYGETSAESVLAFLKK